MILKRHDTTRCHVLESNTWPTVQYRSSMLQVWLAISSLTRSGAEGKAGSPGHGQASTDMKDNAGPFSGVFIGGVLWPIIADT